MGEIHATSNRGGHILSEFATLAGLGCLVVAVGILVAMPSATGYEISMYAALPGAFWVAIVAAMICGGIAIFASIGHPEDRTWLAGIGVMGLANVILISLPYVRGYRMFGRSDAMTHLGFTRDIETFGSIDGILYPPLHLVILTIGEASGIDPMTAGMIVPGLFVLGYFGAIVLLMGLLFETRRAVLFALPFVMLPILRHAHVGLRPFDVSVMLVPLLLVSFVVAIRQGSPIAKALMVVILTAVLLYHPLTALFMLGVLGLYLGSDLLPTVRKRAVVPTNAFSIAAAIFLIWYTSYTGIIVRFHSSYLALFGPDEGGETRADAYTGTIEQASPALLDLGRIFAVRYGLEFLLFGIGFAFVGATLVLALRSGYRPDTIVSMLAGTVVVFSLGGVAFLIVDLIVPPERPFQIAKLGAIPLVGGLGYLLWQGLEIDRRAQTIRVGSGAGIVLALVVLASLATVSIFESPLGSERNHQVTEMEEAGTAWVIDNADQVDEILEFQISTRRFFHAAHGVDAAEPVTGTDPPDRFGYHETERFGDRYAEDRYLTITELGRIVYPSTFADYPEQWRYTPEDFERLERDDSVDRVYDNGDYTGYLVRGQSEDGEVN